jgi:hypothetical protein
MEHPAFLLVKAEDRRFQPQMQEAQPVREFQDEPRGIIFFGQA